MSKQNSISALGKSTGEIRPAVRCRHMNEVEVRTIAKVTRRLVPFLMLCYFVAYLDRVNVGFAALTMNAGPRPVADRVRLRRRHLLHRLFHLRGAVQPDAGAVRRAQMDRPHHAELGHSVGRHGVHSAIAAPPGWVTSTASI